MKATWNVAVIYEGPEAREKGVGFCDALVERFWTRCALEVSWLAFESIPKEESASELLKKVAMADLVVFVVASNRELPLHVHAWVEEWLRLRGEREGGLVALAPEGKLSGTGPHAFLRQVAHRAGMDFLTELPQSLGDPIPDSLDFYTQRACAVTRVLDDILRQPQTPPALSCAGPPPRT